MQFVSGDFGVLAMFPKCAHEQSYKTVDAPW